MTAENSNPLEELLAPEKGKETEKEEVGVWGWGEKALALKRI